MSLNRHNQLLEPSSVSYRQAQFPLLSKDKAELRALLLEGAHSPMTKILDNDYIEQLRRESQVRMAL